MDTTDKIIIISVKKTQWGGKKVVLWGIRDRETIAIKTIFVDGILTQANIITIIEDIIQGIDNTINHEVRQITMSVMVIKKKIIIVAIIEESQGWITKTTIIVDTTSVMEMSTKRHSHIVDSIRRIWDEVRILTKIDTASKAHLQGEIDRIVRETKLVGNDIIPVDLNKKVS